MPPLPSPGPVLRCAFSVGTNASIEASSRIYIGYSGSAPSAGDLATFATAISSAWGSHIAPVVSSAESLHGVEVIDLSSASGNIGTWTGTVSGSRSGDELLASACMVMNHKIARRYRGGRPRTYLRCGVYSDLSGTNEWGADFLSATLSGWEDFISEVLATTGIGITSLQLLNVGYYEGNQVFLSPSGRSRNIPQLRKVAGVATPNVDAITSTVPALKVGSQRRRLDI